MQTAKKLGFKKGDFVHTGLFPGIIIGNAHTATPTLEVWGYDHEMGSAYADELTPLTWPEFEACAKRYGFDGKAWSDEARDAIQRAVSGAAKEAPATA